MAVISTQMDTNLVIRYQTGLSGSGAPILRQKTLANVKAAATDQDVYDVAAALFGLLQYPLVDVRRDDRFDLVNA